MPDQGNAATPVDPGQMALDLRGSTPGPANGANPARIIARLLAKRQAPAYRRRSVGT